SFHSAQQIDPGFRTENLVIVSIDPALAGYDQKRGGQIARDIVELVRRDPQVRNADLGQFVPLGFGGEGRTIVAEGRDENAESNRKIATSASSLRVTLKPCAFRFCGAAISPNTTPVKTPPKSRSSAKRWRKHFGPV